MDIKVGQILSETSYFEVTKVTSEGINVKVNGGREAGIDKHYVENNLKSAHDYSKEVKVTKTEIADKFISSTGIACTVNFNKQVKELEILDEIMNTYENATPRDIKKKFRATIKTAINGEERTMIGYHEGNISNLGRIQFTDMEIKTGHNQRQVDPRTINWLIVDDVKYIVK